MLESDHMSFKNIILFSTFGLILAGCNSTGGIKKESYVGYNSPQDVIAKKQLNADNGRAKAYVYSWGKGNNFEPQSLYPRKHLAGYCQAENGKFTLLHKSQLSQVKDAAQRKRLAASGHVTQGIGAYQCVEKNGTRWIVSIEPSSERRDGEKREVLLQTKIMSQQEAQRFYRQKAAAEVVTPKKTTETSSKNQKAQEDRALAEVEPVEAPVAAATPAVRDTPQQQQSRLYVNARRDINNGRNVNNACNNAQRAYNYGKLPGAEGTRIYTESGMLVARCLTSVSAYSTRFPNAKAQAKRILQNLAKNYNHAGAKNMLNQMK
jgi:hypothetical protein